MISEEEQYCGDGVADKRAQAIQLVPRRYWCRTTYTSSHPPTTHAGNIELHCISTNYD